MPWFRLPRSSPLSLWFFLRPLVPGSYLFGAGLPEENIYAVFLRESLPELCRIQRFLVRQWMHVTPSLRLRGYSDPAIDSRPALRGVLFRCREHGVRSEHGPLSLFRNSVSVFSAMLGPQWYMLCVTEFVVDFPVVVQRPFPMVQTVCRTKEIPLLLVKVIDDSCCTGRAGRRISCRGAEAVSHGPDCCRTKEIPLLLFDMMIDVPVVQVVQLPRWCHSCSSRTRW